MGWWVAGTIRQLLRTSYSRSILQHPTQEPLLITHASLFPPLPLFLFLSLAPAGNVTQRKRANKRKKHFAEGNEHQENLPRRKGQEDI